MVQFRIPTVVVSTGTANELQAITLLTEFQILLTVVCFAALWDNLLALKKNLIPMYTYF